MEKVSEGSEEREGDRVRECVKEGDMVERGERRRERERVRERGSDKVRAKGKESSTCDSVHLWRLNSAVPLVNQAVGIMTKYPIQSHYLALSEPVLALSYKMLSFRLGSDNYQFDK